MIVDAASSGHVADLTKLPRADREIGGEAFRSICLTSTEHEFDPAGIRVKGAIVTSVLDLRSCVVGWPLRFCDSTFRQPVRLSGAKLYDLALANCSLSGLFADWTEFAHGLSLANSRICGRVVLVGARVRDDLDCSGTTLLNAGAEVLFADLIDVGGNVVISNGFSAKGAISFRRARIAGDFDAAGATLERPNGFALIATGATIGGRVGLDGRFRAVGTVVLAYADIGSDLDCRQASFDPAVPKSLIASRAKIQGNVGLIQANSGPIELIAARIGGDLLCMGTRLFARNGDALTADAVEVGGRVDFSDAGAVGAIRLTGARIHGDLVAKGAMLNGGLQRQFDASNLTPPERHALAAGRTEIDGNVALNGVHASGEIRLVRARIAGDLDLSRTRLSNEYGMAVTAAECTAGRLVLWNAALDGGINLSGAHVNTLDDDIGYPYENGHLGSWGTADPLVLSGFAYKAFEHKAIPDLDREHGHFARVGQLLGHTPASDPWDPEFRFPWLEKSQHFDSADWQQLISTYRANGHEDFAVRAEVERQNDRLRRANLSRLRWFGRWILRITIGHGYRSWLALAWAIPVIAVFAILVSQDASAFVAGSSAPSPTPPPVLYSLDTFLPIIDLGLAGKWVVEGWLQWAQTMVVLLGWILSTLFVAGFTKVIRS